MEPIIIENAEAFKKKIVYAGFGNRFDKDIENALAARETEIRPRISEIIENQKMEFEPEFKIKENKGYYNGFKGILYQEDGSTIEQWFKASDRITMNEAWVLLMDQQHPRAIHKTYYDEQGEKYGQWIQLDFSQKTDSGNHLMKRYKDFDLAEKINDFAIVQTSTTEQKIDAASRLSEGRAIAVTPVNQENYQEVWVLANPSHKTLTFLDVDRKLLPHDQFRTPEARERVQQERNKRPRTIQEDQPQKGKTI